MVPGALGHDVSKNIGVLRSMFPDYVISCDYDITKRTFQNDEIIQLRSGGN